MTELIGTEKNSTKKVESSMEFLRPAYARIYD